MVAVSFMPVLQAHMEVAEPLMSELVALRYPTGSSLPAGVAEPEHPDVVLRLPEVPVAD
jgi:hypothetical protein